MSEHGETTADLSLNRGPEGLAEKVGRVRQAWRKWRAFVSVGARFGRYFDGRKRTVVLAVLAALCLAGARLAEPWPIKLIIDNVLLGHPLPAFVPDWLTHTDGSPHALLYALVAAILVIACLAGLFYYLQKLMAARLGIEVSAALRHDLYGHVQSLSLAFHDRRRTGDLLVRLTSDIRILRQAFVSLPLEVSQGLLIAIGMTVVMFLMDWQLTLLALLLLPVLAYLVRRYHRPLKQAVREQRAREGELASMATEALGAIQVVQGLRREEEETTRFGRANKGNARSEIKAARFEAKLRWSSEIAVAAITAVIVLLATNRILSEALSPGDLIVFLAYLRAYGRPFRRVSGMTQKTARAAAAGERVLQILDTQSEVSDSPAAVDAPRLRGEVVYQGVSFRYRADAPGLDGVDLAIDAGERVAVVGPTGAGKSTLVSLLPRFYDPSAGRVLIDGRDIRDFTLTSLRRQISMVFQEPVLFATTIAENIAYGKPNATLPEVVEAARRAGIHDHVVRLPDGYDTVIGERGGTLSGGQRQCVAIARAMIGDAPLVILDEPTTGLDAESSAMVMAALDRLTQDKTVLIISHDLGLVRNADRIVVIEGGRIVQQGSYSDVTVEDGLFSKLERGALDKGSVVTPLRRATSGSPSS